MRVLNDSCIIAEDFRNSIHGCYDAYFSGVEEKKPFGVKNGTAYVTLNTHACLLAVGFLVMFFLWFDKP